jgi:septal ring factor EnvC (AmiA/AmiB activator)
LQIVPSDEVVLVRSRIVLVFCCIAFGIALVLSRPAVSLQPQLVDLAQNPSSLNDLQQQQQQLDRQRNEIQQERDRLQNLEESAQDKLGGLQTNIQVTSEQIAENEKKLQTANEQLKTLRQELAKAEDKYREKQFATVARLRYLQRQKTSQGWALLL